MESVDLETIVQSEVGQKERNRYNVISLMYGIQKNGVGEIICKAEIENQCMDTKEDRGGGGMNWEIGINIYTPFLIL